MFVKKLSEILYVVALFLIFSVLVQCEFNTSTQCPNDKTSLRSIRKRRHLTFPDGSNIVLTISTVKAIMTHAPAGWNIVLEIDVLYPLPNHNFTATHLRRKLHHRQKREFWDKLRNGIDYHNLNGRACVLRSICEAQHYLAPPGQYLVHDLLRVIFTARLDDEEFVDEIRSSYSELMEPGYCDQQMDCPFSPLHFILSLNKIKYQ